MATNKVRYDNVAPFANQYPLSRVQSATIDLDLSEEEIQELANSQVVEYAAQTPAVSISIDANEYGSCRNIRALATLTDTGNNVDDVTHLSFDGTSCDIALMIGEDTVLTRTMHSNDAFLNSVSWNFDVGGIATENFVLETDNLTHYFNAKKETYAFGQIPAGSWLMPREPQFDGSGYFVISTSGFNTDEDAFASAFTALKVFVDGVEQNETPDIVGSGAGQVAVTWQADNVADASTTTGDRYRLIAYRTDPATTVPQLTSSGSIGGITRGMIDVSLITGFSTGSYLDSDFATAGTTDFLRLQSVSIDADMNREVLEQLGSYRAYDRSLTLPIPVTLQFSTIDHNLDPWGKFQGDSDTSDDTEYGIGSFTKTAVLRVGIYDKKDTESDRTILKALIVSGIQITAFSHSTDAGGNATADYTAKASNFLITGLGDVFDGTS